MHDPQGEDSTVDFVLREFAPHPYQALDTDGNIITVNEAWLDALGYQRSSIEGEWFGEFVAISENEFEENFAEYKAKGSITGIEYEMVRADGERIHVSYDGKIEYDGDGNVSRAHCQFQDITDLKRAEEQLKVQRDRLETLNQIFRHDIRNELQIITAYVEELENRFENAENEYISTIREHSLDAVELTEEARELTEAVLRTEEDRIPISLRTTLVSQIESIRSKYTEVNIEMDGSIPDRRVMADDLIGSLFRNILENAVRHNDEDVPEITIFASVRNGYVVVRIKDNGPGIPDQEKDEIFAEGVKGRESSGSGLGLYLVRSLVEQYDGAISVEDNSPKGAVFDVKLPIAE